MDNQKSSVAQDGQASTEVRDTTAKSLAYAERGIKTGSDFAGMMSALMGDIIAGRVTPQVGNATCNAGGKLLRIVEMQYKFGTQAGGQTDRVLTLVPDAKAE